VDLPLDVEYKYRATGGDKELSEAIAAMLEDVGFRVKHTILEGGEYLRQLSAFEWRNLVTAGIVVAPDAQYIFNTEIQTGPYSYYRNPDFDEVVLRAQVELDPSVRTTLLQNAARIACENPSNIYLFNLEDLYGVSERVIGWEPSPDYLIYLDGVSLR
jgi:peptide/nickel transport system substrate-binding protein